MNNWQRWKGIMKCYPFEERRLKLWEPPYIVQPKYDGVRCRAVPTDNGYLLLSSEENVIFSVPHINESLNKLGVREELDGELYCHGLEFERIVSITSRTTNLHPDYQLIKFHCFDIINGDYQLKRLLTIVELEKIDDNIEVAPFWICNNLDEITKVYDRLISLGYEGIVVRHKLNIYERKRSTYLMKFKPKKQDEYEIVGVVEEVDKNGVPKGQLGALVCKGDDGHLFNVGTGFTEERRKQLWDIKEILPGMKAIVRYQHITFGKKVPRFPVFVELTI